MTHSAELLVTKHQVFEWLPIGNSYVCHENYLLDQPPQLSFPIPLCGKHGLEFRTISGLTAHDLIEHDTDAK
jgi:hypothetical protein